MVYLTKTDRNAVTGPKRAVHKQMATHLNELKQVKKSGPKFLHNNVRD